MFGVRICNKMVRYRSRVFIALCGALIIFLGACGQKGSLFLPDEPEPDSTTMGAVGTPMTVVIIPRF